MHSDVSNIQTGISTVCVSAAGLHVRAGGVSAPHATHNAQPRQLEYRAAGAGTQRMCVLITAAGSKNHPYWQSAATVALCKQLLEV
jgi:hypothetical protein